MKIKLITAFLCIALMITACENQAKEQNIGADKDHISMLEDTTDKNSDYKAEDDLKKEISEINHSEEARMAYHDVLKDVLLGRERIRHFDVPGTYSYLSGQGIHITYGIEDMDGNQVEELYIVSEKDEKGRHITAYQWTKDGIAKEETLNDDIAINTQPFSVKNICNVLPQNNRVKPLGETYAKERVDEMLPLTFSDHNGNDIFIEKAEDERYHITVGIERMTMLESMDAECENGIFYCFDKKMNIMFYLTFAGDEQSMKYAILDSVVDMNHLHSGDSDVIERK